RIGGRGPVSLRVAGAGLPVGMELAELGIPQRPAAPSGCDSPYRQAQVEDWWVGLVDGLLPECRVMASSASRY
ncbi:MAG: hypothetical protein OXC91_04350, partial [Rhodobacteraceae bacterium]|nr:hypothetical protein [Paracoccaceae bacterium]